MALGSLIDAGADLQEVLALLRRLPFDGWDLRVESTSRGGVSCAHAIVSAPASRPVPEAGSGAGAGSHAPSVSGVTRTHADIVELIRAARLPDRVASRALAIFASLADAEGRVHGLDPRSVHFHEVGGHDAIVDIVGTAAALEVLGVDEVVASPVAIGTGTLRSEHGILPNPAPAVVHLLRGAPTYGRSTEVELTTPTGAAILAALAVGYGPMPPVEIFASGYGAGSAVLDDLPNCLQVVIGRATAGARGGFGSPLVVLETNVDDVTGEQLAYAVAQLMEGGALDAWISPIVMKKGRPAHTLHALCSPELADALREVLHRTTGTFGVRAVHTERWAVPRAHDEVDVLGSRVAMKAGGGRVKAEFEDVAEVAGRTGLPLQEVSSRAEEAWRRQRERDDGPATGQTGAHADERAGPDDPGTGS
jgi:uncharacterized protein (TIGR00299 family) protein